MPLSRHHRWALTGAVLTSAIALTDAVTHGLTGGFSPFSEESDLTLLVVAGTLVHGLAYVAFAVVLLTEAGRFSATNRVARSSRWVVLASLAVLAAGFLTVSPVATVLDAYDGTAYAVFGIVAGLGFAGLLLGSMVMGLALLRTDALGLGARVLALLLPALGVTLLLAWLSPLWAHPAYVETLAYVGLALLGVGAGSSRPATRAATTSSTSTSV